MPKVAKGLGTGIREFKKGTSGEAEKDKLGDHVDEKALAQDGADQDEKVSKARHQLDEFKAEIVSTEEEVKEKIRLLKKEPPKQPYDREIETQGRRASRAPAAWFSPQVDSTAIASIRGAQPTSTCRFKEQFTVPKHPPTEPLLPFDRGCRSPVGRCRERSSEEGQADEPPVFTG